MGLSSGEWEFWASTCSINSVHLVYYPPDVQCVYRSFVSSLSTRCPFFPFVICRLQPSVFCDPVRSYEQQRLDGPLNLLRIALSCIADSVLPECVGFAQYIRHIVCDIGPF